MSPEGLKRQVRCCQSSAHSMLPSCLRDTPSICNQNQLHTGFYNASLGLCSALQPHSCTVATRPHVVNSRPIGQAMGLLWAGCWDYFQAKDLLAIGYGSLLPALRGTARGAGTPRL